MSDLALSLIRAGVQTVWGFLAALAIAHGIGLSRTAPEWAVQAVTAGVMLAAVAVLRLVERRWPGVGRWLMWGIQALPRYIRPGAATGGVVTGPGPFLEVRHDPAPFVLPNATAQRLRGMTAAEAEGYIPRRRDDAAPATSTTTSVPPDPAQVHDLTRETQTGGSTTASGAATVKLDPAQPPASTGLSNVTTVRYRGDDGQIESVQRAQDPQPPTGGTPPPAA